MRRSLTRVTVIAAICALALALTFSRGGAAAQQSLQPMTAGQQVAARYILSASIIPPGLKLSGTGTSAIDNVLVAALAEDPADIQKIISRGRLDGIEQDFSKVSGGPVQIQLQLSLYRDNAGAVADIPDPSLLAGLKPLAVSAPSFADASAAYTTKGGSTESTNIIFAAGRLEVLVSEVGPPGSVEQADILPLTRLMESRSKLPPPPPTADELAVLQTQTMPESILHAAFDLLQQNYLSKLPPSQLLGAAYKGAVKALTDAGATGLPAGPSITADEGAWGQFLPAFQSLVRIAPASVSARDLAYAAATEMYDNLNCHTTFFTPRFYSREIASLRGTEAARIGILLQKFPESPYVILRVEAGSPAEQAGLKPGDVILAVDHQTPEQAAGHFTELFVGRAGSAVTLTLQRFGIDQPLEITLVRQLIKPVIEQHRILAGGIGYVELDEFTDGDASVTGVANALTDFQAAGNVDSWVLDLRYNSGGSERTLARVAGLFVQPGSILVTETEQDGTVSIVRSVGIPPSGQKSMVVLIGQDTASAAEIFTQALKDLGRVTLVGETTSGCVNGGLPLGLLDGSGVFVSTIDVRSGPNKVALERVGVMPDVAVKLALPDVQRGVDPVLAAAVSLFGGTPPSPRPADVPGSLLPFPRFIGPPDRLWR